MAEVYTKQGNGRYTVGVYQGYDLSHIDFNEEHKTQCPKCEKAGYDNSCDNLHVYGLDSDDLPLGAKCWRGGCGFKVVSQETVNEQMEEGSSIPRTSTASTQKKTTGGTSNLSVSKKDHEKLKEKRLTPEALQKILDETGTNPQNGNMTMPFRMLDKKTCEEYGVRFRYCPETGVVLEMLTPAYIKENGKWVITGFTVRRRPKQFYREGYVGKLNGFMGQHINEKSTQTLVIVGGEVDCITTAQILKKALGAKYNRDFLVVSALNGEGTTAEMIKDNYEFVNGHNKIVMALDNDAAGIESTNAALEVLAKERTFLAQLRHNDPNDYLKNEDTQFFAQDVYWSPKPATDFGIIGSSKLAAAARKKLEQVKIPFPLFLKDMALLFTDDSLGLGEWVNIISSTSIGKSTIIDAWSMDWVTESPYKQAVLTFEADDKSYGLKVCNLILSKNIQRIKGHENRLKYFDENVEKVMEFLVDEEGRDKFYFIDKTYPTLEGFKKAIMQLVKAYGVKVLWIDPMMNLMSMCKSLDEKDALCFFLDEIRQKEDVTIMSVVHTRKNLSSGKSGSQGGQITEEDSKGSQQIIASATVNIILERDKESDDPIIRNTVDISVTKSRTDGQTGRSVAKLFYRAKANKLYPYSYAESRNFFRDDDSVDVLEIEVDDDVGYSIGHITDNMDKYDGENPANKAGLDFSQEA